MTTHRGLIEIHHSLNCQLEKFSHIQTLQVAAQVRNHGNTYDVAALLFDSGDALLMNEVYKCDIDNEKEAMVYGKYLLSAIEVWIEDKDVALIENVNFVSL